MKCISLGKRINVQLKTNCIMNITNKLTMAALALAVPGMACAQVVKFPMEVSADGTIAETVSGNTCLVEGALAPVSVTGAKGKAWRLDGYSSYAKASIDPTKINGQNQITISMWVAPESYPMMRIDQDGEWFTTMAGNMKLTDTNGYDSTDKGFAFQLGSRGSYYFFAHINGYVVQLKANEKLPRYQWNHLVVTIDCTDAKKITMYNNGTEVASRRVTMKGVNGGDSDFYIGKSSTDDKTDKFCLNTFNGIIDDIEIYTGIQTSVVNEKTDAVPVLTYSPERYASDILRPAFHGMPSAGWTNETHGATYYGGKYHVFFQKNPNGPYMARLNWGHIVSDNLYSWHEERTAISPEESYDLKGCWSGCVFTDDVLTGGKPNIFYTGVDYSKAMISQATPQDDDLIAWTKPANNPLINGRPDGLSDDFRDCYVFRNGDNYYMIVGTSKNGIGATTLHRYDASTGTWSNNKGDIFFSGSSATQDGTFWEMPNITKIGDKWLFTATPQNTGMGVRTLYWTGSINADGTFCPDSRTPKTMELSGFTRDGYGLLSPTIFRSGDKTLLLGIVPDKLASDYNYSLGYAHTYSLPREISLDANGNLVQKPFSGLTAMRTTTQFARSSFSLNGSLDLSPVEGRKLELSATVTAGSNDFGFTFFGDGSRAATLTYSPSASTLTLNVSGISRIVQDDVFGGIYQSAINKAVATGQDIKLTLYVDHSIVDIFVNDTYASSVRVFPTDQSAVKATMFSSGEVSVKNVEAYVLDENNTSSGISTAYTDADDCHLSQQGGNLVFDLPSAGASLSVFDATGRCLQRVSRLAKSGSVAINGTGLRIVRLQYAGGRTAIYKMV